MATAKVRADRFLWGFALFVAIYCILGFGLRALTNQGSMARIVGPVVLHAALMTAWLVLFAWQVWLRQAGKIASHRLIGAFGGLLAVGIVATGLIISWRAGRDFGSAPFFLLNAVPIAAFGVLVALAIAAARRGRLDAHRRYMLVATTIFAGPATARWLSLTGIPSLIAPLLLLVFVVVVPLVYDRLTGKWHRASRIASAIAVGAIVLGAVLGLTPVTSLLEPWFS